MKMASLIETREQKKICSLINELEEILFKHVDSPGVDITDLEIPNQLVRHVARQMLFHTKAFPGVHDLDYSRLGVLAITPPNFSINYYTTWAFQEIYDNAV
jgi:hypothetical protein